MKSEQMTDSEPEKKPPYKAYALGVVIIGVALAAHISNALRATVLASVLAAVVLLSLTVCLFTFVLRKAAQDAVGSDSVQSGGSTLSQAAWKVLWLIPVFLFTFGFFGDLFGFKEVGKWIGVTGVLAIIPIIPAYILMGIERSRRKRRSY